MSHPEFETIHVFGSLFSNFTSAVSPSQLSKPVTIVFILPVTGFCEIYVYVKLDMEIGPVQTGAGTEVGVTVGLSVGVGETVSVGVGVGVS